MKSNATTSRALPNLSGRLIAFFKLSSTPVPVATCQQAHVAEGNSAGEKKSPDAENRIDAIVKPTVSGTFPSAPLAGEVRAPTNPPRASSTTRDTQHWKS